MKTIIAILLLSVSCQAAERFNLRPIQGGHFDWQDAIPATWSGSDGFGDYKVRIAEMTYILVDENDREICRCLELQSQRTYYRIKPRKGICLLADLSFWESNCKWFQDAARRAERRCVDRTGSGYTHFERPCETCVIMKIQTGVPSA